MEGQTTIKYLQRYLREKDLGFLACAALPPGEERQKREAQAAGDFFRKLVEEVGRSPGPSPTGSSGSRGSPSRAPWTRSCGM